MSATVCGASVCAARVAVFLYDPADDLVAEPCTRCVAALADALGVVLLGTGTEPSMRTVLALAGGRS